MDEPMKRSEARSARAGMVDFVITNPGNYVELEASLGASRIASLTRRERQTIAE